MSASLVGSEMCIRDRPCAPSVARSSACGATSSTEYSSTRPPSRPSPSTCLLYTSDAADDM
eukprot:14225387-Alexandrium_andersonii.AAC.1